MFLFYSCALIAYSYVCCSWRGLELFLLSLAALLRGVELFSQTSWQAVLNTMAEESVASILYLEYTKSSKVIKSSCHVKVNKLKPRNTGVIAALHYCANCLGRWKPAWWRSTLCRYRSGHRRAGGREVVAALPIESSHFRVVCSEADSSKSTLSFIRNADVFKWMVHGAVQLL